MKYIGNEARWITDEMMLLLQNNAGSKLPVWSPDRFRGHPLLDKIRSAGEEYFYMCFISCLYRFSMFFIVVLIV